MVTEEKNGPVILMWFCICGAC